MLTEKHLYEQLTPDETAHRILEILHTYLGLKRAPEFLMETVYDPAFGPHFVPVGLKMDALTPDQYDKARTLLKPLFTPLTQEALHEAYERMRLSSAGSRLPVHDEKMRCHVFCDALKAYPPCVVSQAVRHPFKFFPSLGELTEVCQNENRCLAILKETFFDNETGGKHA